MQGFTILPTWLTSLVPSLKPKQPRRDPFDYDPLPPPRIRTNRLPITRPSSLDSAPSLESFSALQPQSRLLKVLPREIRQQIWSHVLGGHTIHLEIVGARLGCLYCLSADPNTCNDGRCARQMGALALPERVGKLSSLLTTCRQIYIEAIDILYSSNTFAISDPAVIEYIPLALLPQRINAIRTLRFLWQLPNTPPIDFPDFPGPGREAHLKRLRKWKKIWKIISTIAGLRELHIKLNVPGEWATLNREAAVELLEPLRQVTKPEVFLLSLPFPAMYEGMPHITMRWSWAARNGWEGSDPWDELPNCTIRRVQSYQEL
ncbi:hypothetical protein N431DRAFT_563682 [Stipitochalara longipes BDJ]|nr:hypothetical protein N431DRAFT_563682 [Stipitochalara longipes BDJ]